MEITDIEKLVSLGESSKLEFKKSLADINKIGATISSFSNTEGGTILIGITDNQKILGLEITDNVQKKIANLFNHFDPKPLLSIKYIPIPGSKNSIISLKCNQSSHNKIIMFKGRAFSRNQSTVQLMSFEEIQNCILDSDEVSKKWESLPTKFSIDDLDHEEIQKTMNIGVREGRIPQRNFTTNVEDILIHLGLYKKGILNNAALILFGKDITYDYIHCSMMMGRFLDEGMNRALDSKQIRGNAFYLFQEAEDFIRRHLPIASHFQEGSFERIDEAVLPLLAIREAIVNAICHRDYSKGFGDITIKIFNSQLEIYNIGKLFAGQRIEDLEKPHPSLRRNDLISQTFFCRKLIDKWGGGISRIQKECSLRGIPNPIFSEYSGGICITFQYKIPIGPIHVDNTHTKTTTSRQKEILTLLQKQSKASFGTIKKNLIGISVNDRTLRRDLILLKEKKLIQSTGNGKYTQWSIIDKQDIL